MYLCIYLFVHLSTCMCTCLLTCHSLFICLSLTIYSTKQNILDFESKVLVVTFRGTEQIKVRDIMTDINLFQSHYFPNAVRKKKKKNKNEIKCDEKGHVKSNVLCHTGFLRWELKVWRALYSCPNVRLFVYILDNLCVFPSSINDITVTSIRRKFKISISSAFRSVCPALLQVLHGIFASDVGDDRPWRIHITGHSLGGITQIDPTCTHTELWSRYSSWLCAWLL